MWADNAEAAEEYVELWDTSNCVWCAARVLAIFESGIYHLVLSSDLTWITVQ